MSLPAVLAAWIVLALGTSTGAQVAPANPQIYLDEVRVLSSNRMEGRGPGTHGLQLAEQYIESKFRKFGLKPAGVEGYRQPFTVTTGARLKGDNYLRARLNGAEKSLALGRDYIPLSFSSTGLARAELVFAGYGATAPEFHYDDYAGLDVNGKIVIVLRNEPKSFEEVAAHQGPTAHAAIITKAINARDHGARAMVLVNGELRNGQQDLLLKFGGLSGPEDAGIPVIQVKNSVAASWLQGAGKSLSSVQEEIDRDRAPHSFALPSSIELSLNVDIEKTHARVANVIGYLPGKSDEYVIIGAHYDHLGRGDSNSLAPSQIGQIHHGADDNASGTAGVLELARMFSQERGKLDRGILFMTFSGEELGLLGSAYWVNHPTLPLEKAVAMINLDMIGRMKNSKLYVGGVGTGSSFKRVFDQDSPKYHLDIEYSQGGYASSDHTSFVAKKIPVLFFFSGLHSDYHKPSDTWDKINAQGAAEIVDLVADIATSLDSAAKPPQYLAVAPETGHGAAMGSSGGYGPYFGSVPDFADTNNGVKFSDITPGSPAAKAGIKAGDVLVQFGDKPVRNLYDFTDALRRSKVGDTVTVKVLREGKPLTAKVTLAQRR